MEQGQLNGLKVWFDDFVAGCYCDDEFVNANLKLKEDHSRRVCDETAHLVDELGLSDGQKIIAETIALLHDVGRFAQFIRYRTYNDPKSVNHSKLSVEVLREAGVLDGIDERERKLIEAAIRYHGEKALPEDLDEQSLFYCKLIRDADKLDVFYVAAKYYRQYRDDPENCKLELEFPDNGKYCPEMVESVFKHRLIDYGELRTLDDMRLLQLGWVYDVNFTATFKRIRQQKFLEEIAGFLPSDEKIEKIKEKVFGYIDSMIARGG
ncbi:MAG: HD domain-containing protein [Planctomycetes bacterium]|nr:HD domain-containing protein [Planctomycetota bacterium]